MPRDLPDRMAVSEATIGDRLDGDIEQNIISSTVAPHKENGQEAVGAALAGIVAARRLLFHARFGNLYMLVAAS